MALPGDQTGEGGGALLGSRETALGLAKEEPILSQDLNRHDGSWSRWHGRGVAPASLHHLSDRK